MIELIRIACESVGYGERPEGTRGEVKVDCRSLGRQLLCNLVCCRNRNRNVDLELVVFVHSSRAFLNHTH